MNRLVMMIKLPAKRFVAALKGVTLHGGASVHLRASVRGPGSCRLDRDARIGPGVVVDLRGGTLLMSAGASIPEQCHLRVGDRIEIGESSVLMHYSVVYGEGGVTVGKRCLIGNHTLIASTTHRHEGLEPIALQGMRKAPVVIGDDVWVGAYSLIDAGVTVGEGAIIAAHSYVRDDVPPFSVVGGVPARVLRMRG